MHVMYLKLICYKLLLQETDWALGGPPWFDQGKQGSLGSPHWHPESQNDRITCRSGQYWRKSELCQANTKT